MNHEMKPLNILPKNPDPQFQSNRNFKVLLTHYLFMIARAKKISSPSKRLNNFAGDFTQKKTKKVF